MCKPSITEQNQNTVSFRKELEKGRRFEYSMAVCGVCGATETSDILTGNSFKEWLTDEQGWATYPSVLCNNCLRIRSFAFKPGDKVITNKVYEDPSDVFVIDAFCINPHLDHSINYYNLRDINGNIRSNYPEQRLSLWTGSAEEEPPVELPFEKCNCLEEMAEKIQAKLKVDNGYIEHEILSQRAYVNFVYRDIKGKSKTMPLLLANCPFCGKPTVDPKLSTPPAKKGDIL